MKPLRNKQILCQTWVEGVNILDTTSRDGMKGFHQNVLQAAQGGTLTDGSGSNLLCWWNLYKSFDQQDECRTLCGSGRDIYFLECFPPNSSVVFGASVAQRSAFWISAWSPVLRKHIHNQISRRVHTNKRCGDKSSPLLESVPSRAIIHLLEYEKRRVLYLVIIENRIRLT